MSWKEMMNNLQSKSPFSIGEPWTFPTTFSLRFHLLFSIVKLSFFPLSENALSHATRKKWVSLTSLCVSVDFSLEKQIQELESLMLEWKWEWQRHESTLWCFKTRRIWDGTRQHELLRRKVFPLKLCSSLTMGKDALLRLWHTRKQRFIARRLCRKQYRTNNNTSKRKSQTGEDDALVRK